MNLRSCIIWEYFLKPFALTIDIVHQLGNLDERASLHRSPLSGNRQNVVKHGLRFEDAVRIFDGFTVDLLDDRFDYGKPREISIGLIGGLAVVVVVHTDRDGKIRIISARPAVKAERRIYEKAIREAFDH